MGDVIQGGRENGGRQDSFGYFKLAFREGGNLENRDAGGMTRQQVTFPKTGNQERRGQKDVGKLWECSKNEEKAGVKLIKRGGIVERNGNMRSGGFNGRHAKSTD